MACLAIMVAIEHVEMHTTADTVLGAEQANARATRGYSPAFRDVGQSTPAAVAEFMTVTAVQWNKLYHTLVAHR